MTGDRSSGDTTQHHSVLAPKEPEGSSALGESHATSLSSFGATEALVIRCTYPLPLTPTLDTERASEGCGCGFAEGEGEAWDGQHSTS
jgi:hypothetical protein